jgi:hypothetical protein
LFQKFEVILFTPLYASQGPFSIVALADNEINRSVHANLVEDSKNNMRTLGNVLLVKISRKQIWRHMNWHNMLDDFLARQFV